MFRKMLGTFTAVAAALLLVGVAWASGDDARDDSSSGSSAVSASADVSSSGSLATESTNTSLDDNSTSTSLDDSTSTSIDDNSSSTSLDDNSSTSISLVDTSSTSTSTTIDSTTSTSIDDGSTSSTIDDNQSVPITTDPKTYDVNGAGTVSLQVVAGQLVLIDVSAASGWSLELDKADSREIKVEFESGDSDAKFEAKLDNGELRVKIERD